MAGTELGKYDVVVIGGGPAGCYAAKTAAENGLRTLILEEHGAIGLPRHCVGWLIGAKFADDIVDKIQGRVMIHKLNGLLRRDAHTGDVKEEVTDVGGYYADRYAFDKEIGKLAVEAGAELMLNTRAIDLIRRDGRVVGVKTNRISEIEAKVVICADGLYSVTKGFAKKELIEEENEDHTFYTGISIELANVRDINPGWIELLEGTIGKLGPRTPTFWQHSESACYMTFSSMDEFYSLKSRDDNIISKRLKDAFPVQRSGYIQRHHMGKYFDKVVEAGIIFVGDASGSSGIIHGMISGHYAGMVAAKAVNENDPSKLFEYDKILKESDIYKSPYRWRETKKVYGSYENCLNRFKNIEV